MERAGENKAVVLLSGGLDSTTVAAIVELTSPTTMTPSAHSVSRTGSNRRITSGSLLCVRTGPHPQVVMGFRQRKIAEELAR